MGQYHFLHPKLHFSLKTSKNIIPTFRPRLRFESFFGIWRSTIPKFGENDQGIFTWWKWVLLIDMGSYLVPSVWLILTNWLPNLFSTFLQTNFANHSNDFSKSVLWIKKLNQIGLMNIYLKSVGLSIQKARN